MKETVLIERAKDGTFWLRTSSIKNLLIGTGHTLEEAKEDFAVCLKDTIDSFSADNLPDELVGLEFDYRYDTASVLEEISDIINIAGLAKEIKINPVLLRRYKKGEYISAQQAKRIEEGIHRIGMRLTALSLT